MQPNGATAVKYRVPSKHVVPAHHDQSLKQPSHARRAPVSYDVFRAAAALGLSQNHVQLLAELAALDANLTRKGLKKPTEPIHPGTRAAGPLTGLSERQGARNWSRLMVCRLLAVDHQHARTGRPKGIALANQVHLTRAAWDLLKGRQMQKDAAAWVKEHSRCRGGWQGVKAPTERELAAARAAFDAAAVPPPDTLPTRGPRPSDVDLRTANSKTRKVGTHGPAVLGSQASPGLLRREVAGAGLKHPSGAAPDASGSTNAPTRGASDGLQALDPVDRLTASHMPLQARVLFLQSKGVKVPDSWRLTPLPEETP